MALSDLTVFQEYSYSTFQELLQHNFNLFNDATLGGLVLVPGSMLGDFSYEAMWTRITGLVKRRNAYGSGAVAAKNLGMETMTKVKVAAGTPPVNIPPSMFTWIQKSPEEAGVVIGRQLAEDALEDMVLVAAKAFVAAVSGVAGLVHDGTAGTITLAGLNTAASKMGDRADRIMCWLMHSKNAFDLYGAALANGQNLFSFGNVKVMQDGFGRPFIVSDSAALPYTVAGPATRYHVLGLTQGAVVIEQNNDFMDNVVTSNGDENIQRTYQAEWTYNAGVKGFAWDVTNGGKSPNDAALTTTTNWDKRAGADIKELAGVLANFQ